jgi:hypothetical protein
VPARSKAPLKRTNNAFKQRSINSISQNLRDKFTSSITEVDI